MLKSKFTALSVGGFLGVMTVLGSQYLVLTAVFGGASAEVNDDSTKSDYQAFSVFSAFLFFIIFVYVAIVSICKSQFIINSSTKSSDASQQEASVETVPSEAQQTA